MYPNLVLVIKWPVETTIIKINSHLFGELVFAILYKDTNNCSITYRKCIFGLVPGKTAIILQV